MADKKSPPEMLMKTFTQHEPLTDAELDRLAEFLKSCKSGKGMKVEQLDGCFTRGMGMRHDGWAELVNDEEHGGCLIPMMMLCHEHDEDPEMRPKPISPEKREEVIVHMAAGLVAAYRYFREHRQAHIGTTFTPEPRRYAPKVGRNDLCPCGSGKKYKRCCGGPIVN